MSYDRAGLKFCKVYTDVSKFGEQCTKATRCMTCSGYNRDFIGSWVYVEVLTNTDKARIVVVAILDVS